MKKAVRLASLLLALTMLLGVFCLNALADETGTNGATAVTTGAEAPDGPQYTERADILKDLGLFLGTTTGYNLEDAATRAQAAVMLVRLLGVENQVKAGTYEHPFTDVPDWADKHVGYMYENELTKGVSATLFGSDRPCEAKMYVTFVLRALGYTEAAEDFTYNDAVSAAVLLDVIDQEFSATLSGKDFLRDDMVMVSFAALSADIKGEEKTVLIDKLVKDEAVDKAKADSYKDDLDEYAAYRAANKPKA